MNKKYKTMCGADFIDTRCVECPLYNECEAILKSLYEYKK